MNPTARWLFPHGRPVIDGLPGCKGAEILRSESRIRRLQRFYDMVAKGSTVDYAQRIAGINLLTVAKWLGALHGHGQLGLRYETISNSWAQVER